jgi:hypothetical protein
MIDCLQKKWWDKKSQAGGFEPGTYVEFSLGALPATLPGQMRCRHEFCFGVGSDSLGLYPLVGIKREGGGGVSVCVCMCVCVCLCVYILQGEWGAWYTTNARTPSANKRKNLPKEKSGFNTTLFPGGPPPQY